MLDADAQGRSHLGYREMIADAGRDTSSMTRPAAAVVASPTDKIASAPTRQASPAAQRKTAPEAVGTTTREQRRERLALMRICLQASLDEIERDSKCGERCAKLLIDRCFYALETIGACWRYDAGPIALTRIPAVLGTVIAETEEVLEGGPTLGLTDVSQSLRVAISLFPDS